MTLTEDMGTGQYYRQKNLEFVFQINSEITSPRFQDFHDFISTLKQLHCNKRQHIYTKIS